MFTFVSYEFLRQKYLKAQRNFNSILEEKENLFSLIQTKKHPQLNQNMIEVNLEPLELQVYLINLANSQEF